MKGVKFGEIHTYQDWKLILTSTQIGFPNMKRETINIPGADGELDFSEVLTGEVKYENRKISFTFVTTDRYKNWKNKISEISNYLHGQKFKIILDEDPSYYYFGRVEINSFKSDKSIGKISIDCEVEPYKYDLYSSTEDWKWDTFNFENGIINKTKDILVRGEKTIVIIGKRKKYIPEISCDNLLQVVFNSKTYKLLPGTQKVLNMEICEGINELKFIGMGKVSINYRGGSL